MPLRFEISKLIYPGVSPHHVHGSRYMINVREKTRLVINRRGQERARAEFAYGSTIKYPIIIIILTNFYYKLLRYYKLHVSCCGSLSVKKHTVKPISMRFYPECYRCARARANTLGDVYLCAVINNNLRTHCYYCYIPYENRKGEKIIINY